MFILCIYHGILIIVVYSVIHLSIDVHTQQTIVHNQTNNHSDTNNATILSHPFFKYQIAPTFLVTISFRDELPSFSQSSITASTLFPPLPYSPIHHYKHSTLTANLASLDHISCTLHLDGYSCRSSGCRAQ